MILSVCKLPGSKESMLQTCRVSKYIGLFLFSFVAQAKKNTIARKKKHIENIKHAGAGHATRLTN